MAPGHPLLSAGGCNMGTPQQFSKEDVFTMQRTAVELLETITSLSFPPESVPPLL